MTERLELHHVEHLMRACGDSHDALMLLGTMAVVATVIRQRDLAEGQLESLTARAVRAEEALHAAQRTLEDIDRSLESAGIEDANEAGDFLDLPTRVDLLADERDHLAFKVGQLAAPRPATP